MTDSSPNRRVYASSARPRFDPERHFRKPSRSSPRSFFNPIRAVKRIVGTILWSLLSCVMQSVFLILPGGLRIWFPRVFWSGICKIVGLRVRIIGHPVGHNNRRMFSRGKAWPVIYISNHSSWLDILVLGGTVEARFISKQEVRRWPFIGLLARLGRTIYVTRTKKTAREEVGEIQKALRHEDNIVLFPEGTSSDGTSMRSFMSSLFAVAKPAPRWSFKETETDASEAPPRMLIQPVSIAYDHLDGLPIGKNRRAAVFSWFGDMELMSHLWPLLQWKSLGATIIFHDPIDPRDFSSRKVLANTTHEIIRAGTEDIRQFRPLGRSPEEEILTAS